VGVTTGAKKPQRAVGYIRVSQVGGREGDSFLSPELQREKIEAWAAYRGFTIAGWYIDLDRPASKGAPPRPEFERMMADARDAKFEAVAVYRLTRFARSVAASARAYEDLEKLGVGLVSVTEDIDSTTTTGGLVRNILFALAEFEAERIGEEWRNVHATRRNRGIAHVTAGVFGYVTEGAEIVAVNEAEAGAVRLAYELRGRGASIGEIRRQLHGAGYHPRKGGQWFPVSSVSTMLRHRYYAGLLPNGLEGNHEALVPRELWDAVQATHGATAAQNRHRSALLSGVLVCAGCGYKMKHEPRGQRAAVYRCTARAQAQPCPKSSTIRARPTEEYVERVLLLSRFSQPAPEDDAAARRAAAHETEIGKLTVTIDRLGERLPSLIEQPGVVQEFERQVRLHLERRADLQSELGALEAERERGSELGEGVGEDGRIVAWADRDLADRRRVVRMLMRRIVVFPAATQGGRANRGIDFEQRLHFDWNYETLAAAVPDPDEHPLPNLTIDLELWRSLRADAPLDAADRDVLADAAEKALATIGLEPPQSAPSATAA
jgi:DNA invertase Pin-like site-specific DNA recombinase